MTSLLDKQLVSGVDTDDTMSDDIGAMLGRSVRHFAAQLEVNKHTRVACVCFQSLAVLASNDEYTRRNIGDNLDFIADLIEAICAAAAAATGPADEPTSESGAADVDILLDDLDLVDRSATIFGSSNGEQSGSTTLDYELISMSWLSLLHSLSRSVHQLRTRFLDDKIATYVVDMLKRVHAGRMRRAVRLYASSRSEDSATSMEAMMAETIAALKDVQEVADNNAALDGSESEQNLTYLLLAIVANLMLEFSPCKEVSWLLILLTLKSG